MNSLDAWEGIGMKIELLETAEVAGLHSHPELWVRVVSDYPMDPKDWEEKILPALEPADRAEIVSRFRYRDRCSFYSEPPFEDEESEGFEQWWIFPALPGEGMK